MFEVELSESKDKLLRSHFALPGQNADLVEKKNHIHSEGDNTHRRLQLPTDGE